MRASFEKATVIILGERRDRDKDKKMMMNSGVRGSERERDKQLATWKCSFLGAALKDKK